MQRLQDRIAVVTGAASGIGRGIAVELARRGCHLGLVDLDPLGLEETARIVTAMDREAATYEVDVADREAVQRLARQVVARFGAAHVLVNNAGVSLTCAFQDSDLADYDWVMGVNFWGVVHGCHAFLPHLRAADAGWIVNLSSIFGCIGVMNQSAYCASKFAVRGFTESLDIELRDTNVGVSCVHPGAVATEIVRNGRFGVTSDGSRLEDASRLIDAGITPDAAARIIVDGMAAGKRRILVGRDARAVDGVARLFPTTYRRGVHLWGRWMGRER